MKKSEGGFDTPPDTQVRQAACLCVHFEVILLHRALLTRGALFCQVRYDLNVWTFKKLSEAFSVNTEAELLDLHQQAQDAGMRCSLIQDAGLTEFGVIPTFTVLAIGPRPKARLGPVTGHLTLY